jgi:DNA-binding CsgD family transcriptional regulator
MTKIPPSRPLSGCPDFSVHLVSIIDSIYRESQFIEKWPHILEQVGQIIGAPFGFVIFGNSENSPWSATTEFNETMKRVLHKRCLSRGEYSRNVSKMSSSRFVADEEVMTIEDLSQQEIFRDFLLPSNVGFGVTTSLDLPTGECMTIGWRRRLDGASFSSIDMECLDFLRPHLAHSFAINATAQHCVLSAVVATLGRFDLPALILTTDRKVFEANSLMDNLKPLVSSPTPRFTLQDIKADAELERTLAKYRNGEATAEITFPVKAASGKNFIARLLPLNSNGHSLEKAATLVLVPVAPRNAPPEALLQSLFNLTPAEAKVARALAGGKSVNEISKAEGVSEGTVRTHVRGVLEKVESKRQIDVVSLLVGLPISLVYSASDDDGARKPSKAVR